MPDEVRADPGTRDDPAAGDQAIDISDRGSMIVATVRLAGCDHDRALAAFTNPALLARWWRGELTADLVPGGEYSVSFPAIPARLAGRVLGYTPRQSLTFSWAWDGDDGPPSTVTVTVSAVASTGTAVASTGTAVASTGTAVASTGIAVLIIEHGPHADDKPGRTARAEHREGWEYFLPRLLAEVSS